MQNSLVSVCVTTYNRVFLLPQTLNAILNQSYLNLQIILVDDCSTDGTKELIETEFLVLDNRIKYIRHDRNLGLSTARNTAIKHANGEYFTFCDDDDEWESDFIEKCVKFANAHQDTNIFCTSTKSKMVNTSIYSKTIQDINGSLKEFVLDGYTPPVAGTFLRTKRLKELKGFSEDIKSGVDHDLWFKYAVNDEVIFSISNAFAMPNNHSVNHSRMTTNVEKRINGILYLLEKYKSFFVEERGLFYFNKFKKAYLGRSYHKFAKDHMGKSYFKALYYFFKTIVYLPKFKNNYLFLVIYLFSGEFGIKFFIKFFNKLKNSNTIKYNQKGIPV